MAVVRDQRRQLGIGRDVLKTAPMRQGMEAARFQIRFNVVDRLVESEDDPPFEVAITRLAQPRPERFAATLKSF